MIRQTGGDAVGDTSTKSKSTSAAKPLAFSNETTPIFSPS